MAKFALICADYEKFPESGKMINAAKSLDIPVFSGSFKDEADLAQLALDSGSSLLWYPQFHYGTRGFFLKGNTGDIFSQQEYLYDYSFIMSLNYSSKIPTSGRGIFNDDAIITTPERAKKDIYKFPISKDHLQNSFFVRPNDGNKSFAGQTFSRKEIEAGISKFVNVNPWELIVLATEKKSPDEEFRFFCIRVGEEIRMVGCRYLPEQDNDVPYNIRVYAKEYAEKIFDQVTMGDSFVLDIAYTYGVPLTNSITIMELNSWNSSSFYSINPIEILKLIDWYVDV